MSSAAQRRGRGRQIEVAARIHVGEHEDVAERNRPESDVDLGRRQTELFLKSSAVLEGPHLLSFCQSPETGHRTARSPRTARSLPRDLVLVERLLLLSELAVGDAHAELVEHDSRFASGSRTDLISTSSV
jgi:hypothetical protein